MNRTRLISLAAAAAAVLATTAAHALPGTGEGLPGYPHEIAATQAVASTTDRAEVRAEARRAVVEGRVVAGEIGYVAENTQAAPLLAASRAAVRAEAAEAVRLGLVATGERSLEYTQPQLAALRAAAERADRVIVAGQR